MGHSGQEAAQATRGQMQGGPSSTHELCGGGHGPKQSRGALADMVWGFNRQQATKSEVMEAFLASPGEQRWKSH